ncbi:hypothetical protein BLNAU_9456 [Blattamonas nauphoetae]|uniref:Uncharacterized protein n=1 Tax=Blattamonas nauphoetae TaxID=2049346 RepID=A0ABQ9XVU5_9EUKA|nr:hypothetical protein BLNAU_9456 [Blattamonas nauphoetae]
MVFCPWSTELLLATTSSTVSCFDLSIGALIGESEVLTGKGTLSRLSAFGGARPTVLVGTTDGRLFCLDVQDVIVKQQQRLTFHISLKVDTKDILRKGNETDSLVHDIIVSDPSSAVSNRPQTQSSFIPQTAPATRSSAFSTFPIPSTTSSDSILSLHFVTIATSQTPLIIICSSQRLFVLNPHSHQTTLLRTFTTTDSSGQTTPMTLQQCVPLTGLRSSEDPTFCAVSADSSLVSFSLHPSSQQTSSHPSFQIPQNTLSSPYFQSMSSFYASLPETSHLHSSSSLRSDLIAEWKERNATRSFESQPTKPHRLGTILVTTTNRPIIDKRTPTLEDKPIMFHNKIKSSGYGQDIRAKAKAKAKAKALKKNQPPKKASDSPTNVPDRPDFVYPVTASTPSAPPSRIIETGRGGLGRLVWAPSGRQLAVVGTDNAVSVVKPFQGTTTKAPTIVFTNEKQILDLGWNLTGSHAITADGDSVKVLRTVGGSDTEFVSTGMVLEMRYERESKHEHPTEMTTGPKSNQTTRLFMTKVTVPKSKQTVGNTPPRSNSPSSSGNNRMTNVTSACFALRDTTILSSSGSSLLCHSYVLGDDPAFQDHSGTDLSTQKQGEHRLLFSLKHPSTSLTAISSPNGFFSPLCITAGSDRSINVIDLPTERLIHTFANSHTRPASHLVTPSLSPFSVCSVHFPDIFMSAALDGIKIWDLRVLQPILTLQTNSQIKAASVTSSSFSPCGRFITTGGADSRLYVYDFRGSREAALVSHTDIVSGTGWSPCRVCLASSSLDGTIRLWGLAKEELYPQAPQRSRGNPPPNQRVQQKKKEAMPIN